MEIHGHYKGNKPSATYASWCAMKNRCNREKDISFIRYGGRGITYDSKWNNFKNFLEDMGVRPQNATLDRINSNDNYYKENCRWSTAKEQANNRSSNRVFEINGIRMTVKDIARQTGIKSYSILSRLNRGMSIHEAILKPYRKYTFVTRIENKNII